MFVFLSSSRAEYGFTPAFKHTHDAGWCQTQIIADIVAISRCRVLPRMFLETKCCVKREMAETKKPLQNKKGGKSSQFYVK